MKFIITVILMFILTLGALLYLLGFNGQREFDLIKALPKSDLVVENARALTGTPYDPLMGMYNNIGAELGFIVCSDLPNIAFGQAGYSFKTLLKESYKKTPEAYNSSNGNNPSNPYFHRRARNLSAYFNAINSLMPATYKPSVGDLVFYKKSKKGYIAHVAVVTEINENGYKIMESAPRTVLAQEVNMQSPINRGWILTGFGRLY